MLLDIFNIILQLLSLIFLIPVFIITAYILSDPIIERYNKIFVCPKKGHIPKHHITPTYETCNLGYNHYKAFKELPSTYCERCYTEL